MRVCDVCKKELSHKGVAKVVIPHWFMEHAVAYDMCKKCASKVEDYINKLTNEADEQREGGDK